MSLWLYKKDELSKIKKQDRAHLDRAIQHHIDTDPVVRSIRMVDRGLSDPEGGDEVHKAARRGVKKLLKGKMQPLFNRLKRK
jgi:hypothetical protein